MAALSANLSRVQALHTSMLYICVCVCFACSQGHTPSPTKLSSTWQIRSDSARVPRSTKASKGPKATEKQDEEAGLLPAVQSASSMSATSTLDVHPEIRTGNDVVEFYAKYGQDSPIKFFYCNRYLDTSLSVALRKYTYRRLQKQYTTSQQALHC